MWAVPDLVQLPCQVGAEMAVAMTSTRSSATNLSLSEAIVRYALRTYEFSDDQGAGDALRSILKAQYGSVGEGDIRAAIESMVAVSSFRSLHPYHQLKMVEIAGRLLKNPMTFYLLVDDGGLSYSGHVRLLREAHLMERIDGDALDYLDSAFL